MRPGRAISRLLPHFPLQTETNVDPTADDLATVLARHAIELPEPQVTRLEQYCRYRWEWNTKVNLTRHLTFERFVVRDLVDSLKFAEFLRPGEKILDVGTGNGVPGVVLAIIREDLDVWLSESVGKRARAVADIVRRLGLDVSVHHGRAEELLADQRFDTLVIRAVAKLRKLLGWFAPHWDAFDRILLVKGPSWVDERGEARHYGLLKGLALRRLASYPLPGTTSQSVLLQIRPQ